MGRVWLLLVCCGACSEMPAAPRCGDGKVDPSEVCDGAGRPCSELGASYSAGQAACRADCGGWDVSACTQANGNLFEVVKPADRDTTRFSTARCNDGTPFGFAVRLAAIPTSTWVIHLDGGIYCDDLTLPCSEREVVWMTTNPKADAALAALGRSGILTDDPAINPDFADANQAVAFYCSSDFWSGATTERRPSSGDPAQGWYFSGRVNVTTYLTVLKERYGLDDGDPNLRVLFGGSSAGSFGAHFNSATVAAHLPNAAAQKRIQLFLDAPWHLDWDDPGSRIKTATVSDREVWRAARGFWGARYDAECEAGVSDPVDCWFGTTWYPIISQRFPTLVQQCAVDSGFMVDLHNLVPPNPSIMQWRTEIRSAMMPVSWLFSGLAMPYHTLAMEPGGLDRGPAGSTLRELLGRFWAGGTPQRVEF